MSGIKLCFITGIPELDDYADYSDRHMVLAQLVLKYPQYSKYYENTSKEILLDNGAFEGEQVKPKELIEVAKKINAKILVCPDVIYDAHKTIERTNEFIKLIKKEKLDVKLLAVPQGESRNEWMDCYEAFNNNPDIDYIGLSILSVPRCFNNINSAFSRIECIESIKDTINKKVHVLGMAHMYELNMLLQYDDFIESVDTFTPYALGARGYCIDGCGFVYESNEKLITSKRVVNMTSKVPSKKKRLIKNNYKAAIWMSTRPDKRYLGLE